MSSFEAATAASTRPTSRAARHEVVCDEGHIAQVYVPRDAATGLYERGNIAVPFVTFQHGVENGCVHLFVHTDDESLKGKTITAKVVVKRKALSSKEAYLYIDLILVPQGRPTHRLAIMPGGKAEWEKEGCRILETPPPLRGVVIFGPLGMKFTPNPINKIDKEVPAPAPAAPEKVPAVKNTKKVTGRSSTGDRKLDRLINVDGWAIKSWGPKNAVLLTRTVRGKTQEMTFYHSIPSNRKR